MISVASSKNDTTARRTNGLEELVPNDPLTLSSAMLFARYSISSLPSFRIKKYIYTYITRAKIDAKSSAAGFHISFKEKIFWDYFFPFFLLPSRREKRGPPRAPVETPAYPKLCSGASKLMNMYITCNRKTRREAASSRPLS